MSSPNDQLASGNLPSPLAVAGQAANGLRNAAALVGNRLATLGSGLQRLGEVNRHRDPDPQQGLSCGHPNSFSLKDAGFGAIDSRTQIHPQRHRGSQEVATIASGSGPGPVTRAELGRATWILLHTTAAQFPDKPTRRQQRDVRDLVNVMSRTYPCAECSKHFREIIRHDPPVTATGPEFQMWMCRFHNTVNKSIGKPTFNCEVVASRWGKLDCDEEDSCTIRGRS